MLKNIFVFLLLTRLCFAQTITGESWISPVGLFSANHGVTLVELPEKILMACWYAGSREGGTDVQIVCSQKELDNNIWSLPQVAVEAGERTQGSWLKNKTVGNPSLFLDPQGVLWLFYSSIQIGGWAGAKVDYKVSKDLGKTWSRASRLIDSFGNLTRTKPILISQSPLKIMLPLYHEFISKNGYVMVLELESGEIKGSQAFEIPGEDHLQPSIVNFNGNIFAYLRDYNKNAVLFSKFNLSQGSWSEVKASNLPNPNSSVDALVSEDKVLMVFNNSQTERSPLSLALSEDGINFNVRFDFEPFGENKEYSYPAFIQTSDGKFQLAYTFERRLGIKHLAFEFK